MNDDKIEKLIEIGREMKRKVEIESTNFWDNAIVINYPELKDDEKIKNIVRSAFVQGAIVYSFSCIIDDYRHDYTKAH